MKMTKKDAEILDYIIGEAFNMKYVSTKDLKPLNKSTSFDDYKTKENEYSHYFEILSKSNVVKIKKGFNDESEAHRIEIKTKEFIDNDGFTKKVQDELNAIKKAENVEKLKTKNLELQNENLEFSQTIREKEAEIRNLEFKIKRIELLKQYWWFIGLCIFLGGLLKELWDIIIA